ncbi:hypothetical protein CMO84_10525 [Candidatus Woesearchaeota archaeon]|jgi:uncharacterized protein YbjQ (UPF0145 family)|nr:hypothetical protein [Candidatus Woesearchaeota archaeon]
MIITTVETVARRPITQVHGLVRGTTVRSRHLGKDLIAVLKLLVGGEVHEYTKLVAEAREEALDRMMAEARAVGADAIVGFRFATSQVSKAAAEVVAYGTAVTLSGTEDEERGQ